MRQRKDQGDSVETEFWEPVANVGGLLLPIILSITLAVLSVKSSAFKEAQERHPDFTEDIVIGIALFLSIVYFVMVRLRTTILKSNKKLLDAMDMRNELSKECSELCDLFRRAEGLHKLRNHSLARIISGKLNECYVPTCDERERLQLLTEVVKHSVDYVYAYTYASETYLERFFLEFNAEVDAYLDAHYKAKNRSVDVVRLLVVPDEVLADKTTNAYLFLIKVIELHIKHKIFIKDFLYLVSESDVLKGIETQKNKDYIKTRLMISFFICDGLVFSHGEKYVSFLDLSLNDEDERGRSSGNVSFYRNNADNLLKHRKNMFNILFLQAKRHPLPPVIQGEQLLKQKHIGNKKFPNGDITNGRTTGRPPDSRAV